MIYRILFLKFLTVCLLGTDVLAHEKSSAHETISAPETSSSTHPTSTIVRGYNMHTADILHTPLDFREEDVLGMGNPSGDGHRVATGRKRQNAPWYLDIRIGYRSFTLLT